VRDAICHFIDSATPFKACCEAGQGVAAIEKAKQRAPALVILDLNISMLRGVETASALRRMLPGTKIIGLAMFAAEFRSTLVASAGFDLILSKDEGIAKLAEAINELLAPPPSRATLGCRVPSVRILVVDDFDPFRQFVNAALGKRPDLQVVGEASDGSEAVQKAAELKPDLIFMDIGLPSLSGIEAARQICKLVPESKIVFLSQESSPEVVDEALGMGAWGYIVKTRAGSELLAAVDSVISGERFLSSTWAN
jgi:DNA-binding NarL/FixJ family response regulator